MHVALVLKTQQGALQELHSLSSGSLYVSTNLSGFCLGSSRCEPLTSTWRLSARKLFRAWLQ